MAPTNSSTPCANPTIRGTLKSGSSALNWPKSLSVDNSKAGLKLIRSDLSQPQTSILRRSRSAPVDNALGAPQALLQSKFQLVKHEFNFCIFI